MEDENGTINGNSNILNFIRNKLVSKVVSEVMCDVISFASVPLPLSPSSMSALLHINIYIFACFFYQELSWVG